jgi:sugar fermentation stimulation protein A
VAEGFSFFTNDAEALFVRRPNRFLIIAGAGKKELPCHCPNPGRLIEFVFPGARLILEKRGREDSSAGARAKTGWTVAGLYYRDAVVPLFSSRANGAAEQLILKEIIPGLREITPEYALGASRFDFLCIDAKKRKHLVEVKACSLVEHGTAMFPDAPSGRALKHLEELADLSSRGYQCHVLFVVTHGKPDVFIPNLHTDPEFAAALSRHSSAVNIHAALLRCDAAGRAGLVSAALPVDLSHGKLAEGNGGSYLILLELAEKRSVEVGALGTIHFTAGWHVYAGSARKNLSQRVNRHLRRQRKQKHWHLDYLTPYAARGAGKLKALPILSYRNLECELAGELAKLGGRPIPRFGSSDCNCPSHLYYFKDPPMGSREFVDMLLRYRHVEALRRQQTTREALINSIEN